MMTLLDWLPQATEQLSNWDGNWWLLAWLALFVLMTLEEMGLPVPLVSTAIVMTLGYSARHDIEEAAIVFGLAQTAVIGSSLAGASAIYWLGRRGGRPAALRLARRLRVGHRLAQLEDWLQKGGDNMTLAGRLVPGLLTLTSLLAGVLRMRYGRFCLRVAVSASVWTAVFFGAGLLGGAGADAAGAPRLAAGETFLVITAMALGVSGLAWLARRVILRPGTSKG